MSLLGSLAFWMFVLFPVYPLVHLARLLTRSRARAPFVVIAITAQNVSFVALAAWFVWIAQPALAPVVDACGTRDMAAPTRAMLELSRVMHTPPGLLIALALMIAAVRGSGLWLASAWRDAHLPVWRIDALALMAWVAMSALLAIQVLSMLVPLVAVLD